MACPARSRSASRQPGNIHPSTGRTQTVAAVRLLGGRCGPKRTAKPFGATGGGPAPPDPPPPPTLFHPPGLVSRRRAHERARAPSAPRRRETPGGGPPCLRG